MKNNKQGQSCGLCTIIQQNECGESGFQCNTNNNQEQSWEDRFDDNFSIFTFCTDINRDGGQEYASKNKDKMKYFISQEIQKAKEKERKRILGLNIMKDEELFDENKVTTLEKLKPIIKSNKDIFFRNEFREELRQQITGSNKR